MIDITTENFETEVILASHTLPVLVDFWAPWCGPCKSLSPLLEKLEAELDGRFALAKVNADEQQELSQAFGIRSLPTCVLMVQGKPVDGFMGALPEGQLRAFLAKHLPSDEALQAQDTAEAAQAHLQSGDVQAALAELAQALETDPANDDVRFEFVKLAIGTGLLAPAQEALAPTLARIPVPLRFEALQQFWNAMDFALQAPQGPDSLDVYAQRLAANKRDFDAGFAMARMLMASSQWEAALDALLDIIMRDKNWGEQAPRKTFVAILELLTPPKPKKTVADNKSAGGIELAGPATVEQDAQTALVSSYRRRLSMALN